MCVCVLCGHSGVTRCITWHYLKIPIIVFPNKDYLLFCGLVRAQCPHRNLKVVVCGTLVGIIGCYYHTLVKSTEMHTMLSCKFWEVKTSKKCVLYAFENITCVQIEHLGIIL